MNLDVAAFAASGETLEGAWPGGELSRLSELQTPPDDEALADVNWKVHGERLPAAGTDDEVWLDLNAKTVVWLTCQRCLQPFKPALDLSRRLRFVRDEAAAEALDSEIDEDVLAYDRRLNLRVLVEDELLLALPLVPRHEHCPVPLPISAPATEGLAADADGGDRSHPFAVLKSLKALKKSEGEDDAGEPGGGQPM